MHNNLSRFVLDDCELLSKHYLTTVRHENSVWKLRFGKIWKEVRKHDLIFCWFASWHSFFPVLAARLLKKPSVVVVGGYDTANVPKAGYGSQRGGFRALLARIIMKAATHLIVNSGSARSETRTNVGIDDRKISVVYHGVPHPSAQPKKDRARTALTVGIVNNENLLRKGILPFVQAAKHLPDVDFVQIGPWQDESILTLRQLASSNVQFLGFVSDEVLSKMYCEASVYVQASLHEGFGMSLAEAMAAGCIPVVTRCTAIPEVAGEIGVYIEEATPEAIAESVAVALEGDYTVRVQAQKRVSEMFSLKQREDRLKGILDLLLESKVHV